jgi:hypothetical protein
MGIADFPVGKISFIVPEAMSMRLYSDLKPTQSERPDHDTVRIISGT